MTFETFKEFINTLDRMNELCLKFDDTIEKLFNMPFIEGGFESDTRCMFMFPMEGIQNLFIESLINEFGESREGAEWFVYEGIDQIKRGGTIIDETEIKSFEEYYKWLCNLKS